MAAGFLALSAPCPLAAQQAPPRPPGVTDQQIQQAIQQRGLGALVATRIRESGLTPDQIRARLQAAGYSPNLLDVYLGAAADTTQRPSQDVLRALAVLGVEGVPSDTTSPPVAPETLPAPPVTAGLQLFGLDVFRRSTTQFSAATSGPVDPDYRLGPGDELVLILTGDVELAHQLPVTREGFIVIPQVGQIFVANLTLDQLRSLLYARLGRVYSGVRRGTGATTRFEITVSRLRVNQVFVNGEVTRPGAYTVSAIGTVMNALYAAGGPTERGNFRAVRVLRRGQAVRTLDLYDYLLGGNTRDDIRLEQGDVVFVPPRGRRVSIEGSVLRPAIYDLAEGQDLKGLIEMSGGLLPEAYTGRAQVERILPPAEREPGGRDRTVIDVDLNTIVGPQPTARFALEPDDHVTISGVSLPVRNRLTLRGNVWRPGGYQLEPGMTLSQLLRAAGGLKTDTYTGRAHILRLMPDSTRRLIPVDLAPIAGAINGSGSGPGGLRAAPPGTDPELLEFDEITIYSRTDFRPTRQIAVYGSVQRQGLYAFRDSMTLRDAVIMAGGLRDDAYLLEAEIARIPETRHNGDLAIIQRVPLDSTYVLDPTGYLRRDAGARGAEPRLQPYDNVFIRRIPGFELQRNVVLSGEVRFPGRYTLTNREERLRDLVQRAGGVTEAAYLRGAQFFRTQGGLGRVGIDFERALRDANYRDNVILFAGDSIFVPEYQPTVKVEGAVNSPVTVAYRPGAGVGYYVDAAGGFARRADRKRTYVVQPNGAVARANRRPEPGARIYVPAVPEGEGKTDWGQVLSAVATVLTSALTIILVVQRL